MAPMNPACSSLAGLLYWEDVSQLAIKLHPHMIQAETFFSATDEGKAEPGHGSRLHLGPASRAGPGWVSAF